MNKELNNLNNRDNAYKTSNSWDIGELSTNEMIELLDSVATAVIEEFENTNLVNKV